MPKPNKAPFEQVKGPSQSAKDLFCVSFSSNEELIVQIINPCAFVPATCSATHADRQIARSQKHTMEEATSTKADEELVGERQTRPLNADDYLARQDLATLNPNDLTSLTPEVISR